LLSFHFGEDRFRRHNPKGVVKQHLNKLGLPWEYTTDVWEEEEVHLNTRTYDEVLFKRQGRPLGRIVDEDKELEEAIKKEEEEASERMSPTSASSHSRSIEEEETLDDKQRRKNEKFQNKNNDDNEKKRKIAKEDKAKAKVEAAKK